MSDGPGGFEKSASVVERVLGWLGALPKIALSLLFVWLVVVNFSAISSGLGGLAKRLPEMSKISAVGLSVELPAADITNNMRLSDVVPPDTRNGWSEENSVNAADGVKLLKSGNKQALIRLLNVGLLNDLCRFSKATPAMQVDYAMDRFLEGVGLVRIENNETTKKAVEAHMREAESAPRGKPSNIGYPSECYDLKLTAKGYDARTWITHAAVDNFGAAAAAESVVK